MTDRRAQMQRSKRRTALAVYAITARSCSRSSPGLLGTRMAQGQDPAIGAGKAKVAQVAAAAKVLVRKIVVTKRVVVRRARRDAARAAAARPPAPAAGPAAPVASPRRRAPRPRRRRRPPPRPRRPDGDLLSASLRDLTGFPKHRSEPAGRPGTTMSQRTSTHPSIAAFPLMGTHMRVVIGPRRGPASPPRAAAADRVAPCSDYDAPAARASAPTPSSAR